MSAGATTSEQPDERQEREGELEHRLVEEREPGLRRPARAVRLGEPDLEELGDRRVEDVHDGELEGADAVDGERRRPTRRRRPRTGGTAAAGR